MIFLDLIRQSAVIVKTEIEVFIKILIKGPLILLLTKTEISTELKIGKAASNIKMVILPKC